MCVHLFIALALIAAAARPGRAQDERQDERVVVRWSARATPRSVKAGDTARVALRAVIDEFYHLYSTTQGPGGPIRTSITLLPTVGWKQVGALRAPLPDSIPDRNFGIMSEVYDDSVTVGLTLRAATAPAPGKVPRLAIRYQACTTRYCLPPRTDTVDIPLQLAKTPGRSR
jgi:hypothetical protein